MANVCQTCGDEGFVEALVHCYSCNTEVVHRYCLDITPVPFLDYVTWLCESCDGSNNGFDQEEVDHTVKLNNILKKSEREHKKKNKKKENKNCSNEKPLVLAEEDVMDVEFVKVSSSSSPKRKTMKGSKRRKTSSDSGKPHELIGLVRNSNSVGVLEHDSCTSKKEKLSSVEIKKKKKKKKEVSNHTQAVLVVGEHGLQDATDVETLKVSSSVNETLKEPTRREHSTSEKVHELTGLERNEASVLEANNGAFILNESEEKKKKKKKKEKRSSKHTQPDLGVDDHEVQDATNVEPVKVSSAHTKETTKKSKRKERSNGRKPQMVENHGPHDATNVESNRQESSDKGKPYGVVRNRASISEATNGASASERCEKKKRKKKKKKSSNDTQRVVRNGASDFETKKGVSILEKNEKKKKKRRKKSSN